MLGPTQRPQRVARPPGAGAQRGLHAPCAVEHLCTLPAAWSLISPLFTTGPNPGLNRLNITSLSLPMPSLHRTTSGVWR